MNSRWSEISREICAAVRRYGAAHSEAPRWQAALAKPQTTAARGRQAAGGLPGGRPATGDAPQAPAAAGRRRWHSGAGRTPALRGQDDRAPGACRRARLPDCAQASGWQAVASGHGRHRGWRRRRAADRAQDLPHIHYAKCYRVPGECGGRSIRSMPVSPIDVSVHIFTCRSLIFQSSCRFSNSACHVPIRKEAPCGQ